MKTPDVKKYIFRLQCCGYSKKIATRTCFVFLKEFSQVNLERFIKEEEKLNDTTHESLFIK